MNRKSFPYIFVTSLVIFSLLAGCQSTQPALPTPTTAPTTTFTPSPEPTATLTATITATPVPTGTPTAMASPTITLTPTPSETPTITPTATVTLTPTPDYPEVTVKMQANCRYGPATAYLYRWGLYPGDKARVFGRNYDGSWLWVQPATLENNQKCWASKIVFNETVDKAKVNFVISKLPWTTFAGPPGNVRAMREGNQVTVTWDVVPLSDDKRRGYMMEVQVCESGLFYQQIVRTDDTSYTFRDDQECEQQSNGLLYTAEKHGYSTPVQIPWPD